MSSARQAVGGGRKVFRVILAFAALAGCARYQPAPLDLGVPLQPSLMSLRHQLPNGQTLPLAQPLSLQTVAALAVLNDPALRAARTQRGLAQAVLLAAGLPPDPTISGGFGALLSGPGSMPAISGALSEDLSALVTYRVERQAAKAGLAQVDADILWQEWQVASQAEQLCLSIAADRQTVASLRADHQALTAVDDATRRQVAAGDLTIGAAATSMAALAATDTALDAAMQTLGQDRDQLDALLGLHPGVDIALAPGAIAPVSQDVAQRAIASLPQRRPDLIALRFGYAQADAKLRSAILMQFLPISIGPAASRDTSGIWSLGPQLSLTLPLFNRNRGGIATARATRAQLAAQFQASLANAAGGAEALLNRAALLQGESRTADASAATAATIAAQAGRAFANGSLDALAEANLQVAAGDREREAIALRMQYQTAELSLATLLGLGLPPAAIPVLDGAP